MVENNRYFVGIALVTSSLISVLVGYFWDRWSGALNPNFKQSIEGVASDFRVWLGLVVLVLFYVMASSIIQSMREDKMESIIKEDIPALNAAMRAYVLPRSLTPGQVSSIARHLSNFEPQEVTVRVIQNDNEASNYRADLQTALERGGWTIKTIEYVTAAREGLTMHFQQTMASTQIREDPRNPKPDKILQQALLQSGVTLDGTGGGSGEDVTTNSLSLEIGHRRRDTLPQPRP